ncbi:hypothetical protein [Gimibacter soli]|uniref:Uncharacterized protein n=1 Tax=Gimibacter soli TaxID=3024400 RepID=A0AAF0BKK3_9PROT|nr:hypothetical protein [Gimibacter soli]WCL53057.1 hypothetical protein PH603_10950 [Gimibacter soli]
MPSDLPLTLFSTFKPFQGEPAVFQQNALRSWALLGLDVILFGDEDGVEAAAETYGFRHFPAVERSENGVPLVSSMFGLARENSDAPYLGYINGDIILDTRSHAAFQDLCCESKAWRGLATARRRNLPLDMPLGEGGNDFWDDLRAVDREYGCWDRSNAVDLFLFTRDIYTDIPPFAVGRMGWDNWLIWSAHNSGGDVIDASADMSLFHPIHGYHAVGGWHQLVQGDDAVRNRQLMDGRAMNLDDAVTHLLKGGELIEADLAARDWLAAQCARDPEREFVAGCVRLAGASACMEHRALVDAAYTLLERVERYFPIMSLETADGTNGFDWDGFARLSKRSPVKAAEMLQDFVLAGFAERLLAAKRQGREICIRGTGGLAVRLVDFLLRRGITPDMFVDRIAGSPLPTAPSVPVISAEVFGRMAHPGRHLVIAASMHAPEIGREYQALGFLPERDILY